MIGCRAEQSLLAALQRRTNAEPSRYGTVEMASAICTCERDSSRSRGRRPSSGPSRGMDAAVEILYTREKPPSYTDVETAYRPYIETYIAAFG